MSVSSDDGDFRWEDLQARLETLAAEGGDLTGGRFSRSPVLSDSTSGPKTPKYRDEGQRQAQRQSVLETEELHNSTVFGQFSWQLDEEEARLRMAEDRGLFKPPPQFDWVKAAGENVKHRWIEQGIWNEQWDSNLSGGFWKHERIFLPVSVARSSKPLAQPLPSAVSSPKKRKRTAANLDMVEQTPSKVYCPLERDASRPCHQFAYQFRKQREWILMGLSYKDKGEDVDTAAYENVKARWIDLGIWDSGWIHMPGVSWRHERPRKYPHSGLWSLKQQEAKTKAEIMANQPPKTYFVALNDGNQRESQPKFQSSRHASVQTEPFPESLPKMQLDLIREETLSSQRELKGVAHGNSKQGPTSVATQLEHQQLLWSRERPVPPSEEKSHRFGQNERAKSIKLEDTRAETHDEDPPLTAVRPSTMAEPSAAAEINNHTCVQPPIPRRTKILETSSFLRAKRQFFQWYWKEGCTLAAVKENFDKLSEDLRTVTGESYSARLANVFSKAAAY